MTWIFSVVRVVHILSCLFLILVVLLQAGKGAGIGSAFGGGSSAALGGRGAGSVISKLTWIVAGLFMVTSVSLAWRSTQRGSELLKGKSKPVSPEKLLLEEEVAPSTEDATGPAAQEEGEPGSATESGDATGEPATGTQPTPATGTQPTPATGTQPTPATEEPSDDKEGARQVEARTVDTTASPRTEPPRAEAARPAAARESARPTSARPARESARPAPSTREARASGQ